MQKQGDILQKFIAEQVDQKWPEAAAHVDGNAGVKKAGEEKEEKKTGKEKQETKAGKEKEKAMNKTFFSSPGSKERRQRKCLCFRATLCCRHG